MKRFILLTLSPILFLPLVGCTTIVNIDWVDFIKFNDITYLQEKQNISINENDLSPYDKVKFKTAENIYELNYLPKNGHAAYLEAGTHIYSLKDYLPSFRLVAKRNQDLLMYEADTNPKAKKGGDLLDISGKVVYVSVNSHIDGKTKLGSITESAQVNQLVQMILEAPVDQSLLGTGSKQYFLEFHLKDGTTTKRSYWLDTGLLQRGIQLPKEFGVEIQAAIDKAQNNL